MSQIYARPALTPFHETSSYVFDKVRLDQLSPRDLGSCSTFAYPRPERKNEGEGWNLAGTTFPMSDQKRRLYDAPAARVGDDYQTRPERSQRPPREQLPPISSLFSASRPTGPDPFLDRSPTFPSNVSPQGPRRTSSNAKSIPDPASWEPTNLQRHPSQSSSHYSYDGRPSVSAQSDLPPPPPRSLQVNRPPNSPRFYEAQRFSPQDPSSRTQLPLSRNGWSPRSDPPYREYFPPVSRDTSSSFRPQLDQKQPLQPPRRESGGRQIYQETPLAAPAASQYPPTPASTSSDSVTTKDVLGPKIWTGTQFLPRYVRSAEVPGEGLCYFYDDGTHCKTHIDGEAVNAHWGVTKAGKPRKRLAIACITCREKKIKCDPDYPRCIQCEKFGRICKFKNAPRGGQGSPETPPHDVDELLVRPGSSRSDEEALFKVEKRDSAHSISSQAVNRPASPDLELPAKRRRYNDFISLNLETETGSFSQNNSPADRKSSLLVNRRSSEQLFAQWTTNPYDANEDLVMALMKTYFMHINSTTYDMFPEKPFMEWLTNSRTDKSKDDLMLIYTMLALATIFSPNPEHKNLGETYAAISRYACDNRHFSLQLVQSRLLLAMYYYANNNPNDSWDFCGSALRAATGLKLNQEIEKTDDSERDIFPFGLSRHGFAECRRRTFWSAYIVDRFNGFCSGHLSVVHPDDVFLRLPCDVKSFNEQAEISNPFFDADTHPPQNTLPTLGAMAYLINIASIWGDVMASVYRTSQRPASCRPQKSSNFSVFHEATTARLEAWYASVPPSLANTSENVSNAVKFGIHGSFFTMHALYHTTHMKLNRYVSPELLTTAQLERNIGTAHSHAKAMLDLLDDMIGADEFEMPPTSSPFVGYAIISAVDILSAKGTVSTLTSLPKQFRSVTKLLGQLAVFWQSARNQKEMMAARVVDLYKVEEGWHDGSVVKVEEGKWQMLVPMERTFARANDCVYGSGLDAWERALEGK